MDETRDTLLRRIERLDSGLAWAEDPPSRTRHFISNVELETTDNSSEVKVYSNFIMYRTRGEREGGLLRGQPRGHPAPIG